LRSDEASAWEADGRRLDPIAVVGGLVVLTLMQRSGSRLAIRSSVLGLELEAMMDAQASRRVVEVAGRR
jgi:hypothetical protein